jgi:Met-zincin
VRPFDLTTRFYLRPESTLEASFVRRENVEGVGFFTTNLSNRPAITRFSLADYGNGAPIHYFIKNVPAQWQPSFDKAFAQWKASFKILTGRDVLTWEFVDPASEMQTLLVTGDARYNILEWDLSNKAMYGGLGPSISDETSGQLLSAQVLIQGPTIMELYTAWFEAWKKARALQQSGDALGAQRIARDFDAKVMSRSDVPATKSKATIQLNSALSYRVPSLDQGLSDPVVKGEFFVFPETESFESYMDGYFQNIVTHELGHNFGLQHNFRGSMGRAGEVADAKVSISTMEYLDRNFRNKSGVGDYDVMAIAYGYTGVQPARKDLFCSDSQSAALEPSSDTLRFPSPECNPNDGSVDGYGYLRDSLKKGVDLLMANSLEVESPWMFEDLAGRFATYSTGVLAYAKAAPDTFSSWKNWTGIPGAQVRPTTPKRARAWVIADYQNAVCSQARIDSAIAAKGTPEAKKATLERAREQLVFVVDFATKNAGLKKEEISECITTLDTVTKAVGVPAPAL